MRESKVEAQLRKSVKALGGETRKVKFLSHDGAPDRLVMLPEALISYGVLARIAAAGGEEFAHSRRGALCHPLVELKAPGKKPTGAQEREHARLRKAGFVVLWLDTVEKVIAVFGES